MVRSRKVRVLSAGFDWLSLTQYRTATEARELEALAVQLIERRSSEGFDESAPPLGHGYRSRGSAGVTWGIREQDVLLVLTGELAREYGRRAYELARNVSRADIQVTVELSRPQTALARRWGDVLRKLNHGARKGRGRRWNDRSAGRVIRGIPWGDTLYVGAKKSDVMLRLYDKGVESGAVTAGECKPGQWWRYEVQHRRKYAMSAALKLMETTATDEELQEAAVDLVGTTFDRRGVIPLFDRKTDVYAKRETQRPDDERRMKWLREQVRPSAERLIDRDHGRESQIAALLTPELYARLLAYERGEHLKEVI